MIGKHLQEDLWQYIWIGSTITVVSKSRFIFCGQISPVFKESNIIKFNKGAEIFRPGAVDLIKATRKVFLCGNRVSFFSKFCK